MVTFNINDDSMELLASQSELRRARIKKPFYVYGLCRDREAERPSRSRVVVYAQRKSVPVNVNQMVGFMLSKGILLTVKHRARKEITIGADLRLRLNDSMFHRVVDTLVYWMDGKLTGLPVAAQPQPTQSHV